MKKRRKHEAGFNARVALEAVKGDRTVSELAAEYAVYRARTKGKNERDVGYVKSNAIAGGRFEGFAALEAHLEAWTREVADVQAHGTTGEPPRVRFQQDEAHRLRPAAGIPPFMASRDLVRKVTADCSVEVDGNAYSVPWRLIGERVTVTVTGAELRVLHAGQEVARHALRAGRHGRIADNEERGLPGGPRWPDRAETTTGRTCEEWRRRRNCMDR